MKQIMAVFHNRHIKIVIFTSIFCSEEKNEKNVKGYTWKNTTYQYLKLEE